MESFSFLWSADLNAVPYLAYERNDVVNHIVSDLVYHSSVGSFLRQSQHLSLSHTRNGQKRKILYRHKNLLRISQKGTYQSPTTAKGIGKPNPEGSSYRHFIVQRLRGLNGKESSLIGL